MLSLLLVLPAVAVASDQWEHSSDCLFSRTDAQESFAIRHLPDLNIGVFEFTRGDEIKATSREPHVGSLPSCEIIRNVLNEKFAQAPPEFTWDRASAVREFATLRKDSYWRGVPFLLEQSMEALKVDCLYRRIGDVILEFRGAERTAVFQPNVGRIDVACEHIVQFSNLLFDALTPARENHVSDTGGGDEFIEKDDRTQYPLDQIDTLLARLEGLEDDSFFDSSKIETSIPETPAEPVLPDLPETTETPISNPSRTNPVDQLSRALNAMRKFIEESDEESGDDVDWK